MILVSQFCFTTAEVLSILSLDSPVGYTASFYCTFVSHVWNVLHKVCRDLSELRHLVSETDGGGVLYEGEGLTV